MHKQQIQTLTTELLNRTTAFVDKLMMVEAETPRGRGAEKTIMQAAGAK